MRYFIELAYDGTNYCGWQIQPKQASVQQTIESALSMILREPIAIVGCGRTDTGVHAKQYFAHFDTTKDFPKAFVKRLNRVLGTTIAIKHILPVEPTAHARFDATHRAYEYHITAIKNPFQTHFSYHFPFVDSINFEHLQAAAHLLLEYDAFTPFCKSNSDAKTMNCQLFESNWTWDTTKTTLKFDIAANRFLRGMVRLVVGMCLNVATEKVTLAAVKKALDTQTPLPKSWSVPPQGLFLTDIRYPYISQT